MARAPRGYLDPLRRWQLVVICIPVIRRLIDELLRHHPVASVATCCRPPSHCPGLPKLGVSEVERVVGDRPLECD